MNVQVVLKKDKNEYNNNKYVVVIVMCIIISVLMTVGIYNILDIKNSRLLNKDMLDAIKLYNVDYIEMFKKKIIFRLLELVILYTILINKFSARWKWFISFIIGLRIGFLLTVFILEMKWVGIINFLIVSMPQDLIYIVCIIYMLENINNVKKIDFMYEKKINNVIKFAKIVFLWGIGIISEIFLNVIMVQKFLIIP